MFLVYINGKVQIKFIWLFNSIKALVVGVFDYWDNCILQLQYVDWDVEVFVEFFIYESFWKVEEENLVLLINEQAIYGNFISEFIRLSG